MSTARCRSSVGKLCPAPTFSSLTTNTAVTLERESPGGLQRRLVVRTVEDVSATLALATTRDLAKDLGHVTVVAGDALFGLRTLAPLIGRLMLVVAAARAHVDGDHLWARYGSGCHGTALRPRRPPPSFPRWHVRQETPSVGCEVARQRALAVTRLTDRNGKVTGLAFLVAEVVGELPHFGVQIGDLMMRTVPLVPVRLRGTPCSLATTARRARQRK